jgi:hypothetical protein
MSTDPAELWRYYIPTTDNRELVLTRYTEPERELKRLLERLNLELPAQPPPRITAAQAGAVTSVSCRLLGSVLYRSITWHRQSLESAKLG